MATLDQTKEILSGVWTQVQAKAKELWQQKWFRIASVSAVSVGALYYSSILYARVYYNTQPFTSWLRLSCLEEGSNVNWTGKGCWAIVTGSSIGGIGYDTALALAKSGLNVILGNRNPNKSASAENLLRNQLEGFEGAGEIKTILLDLSKPESVDEFADNVTAFINDGTDSKNLIVLCNNAAVAGIEPDYSKISANDGTEYNIEKQWVTNYLMAVLLTEKLLPLIQEGSERMHFGRIVEVSSMAHNDMRPGSLTDVRNLMTTEKTDWSTQKYMEGPRVAAYGETKSAVIVYVAKLAQRPDIGCIKVCAPHPGFGASSLLTNASHNMSGLTVSIASFLMSPAQIPTSVACRTQVHCCLSMNEEESVKSGSYHYDCHYQDTGRLNKKAKEEIDSQIRGDFVEKTLEFLKRFDRKAKA